MIAALVAAHANDRRSHMFRTKIYWSDLEAASLICANPLQITSKVSAAACRCVAHS